MSDTSNRVKNLVSGQRSLNNVVLLVIITTAVVIFFYMAPSEVPEIQKSSDSQRPTIDDIRAAYDPIIHKDRLKQRVKFICNVSTPTREEASKNVNNWSLSRYVSYHNVVGFLEGYLNNTNRKYIVQDFGYSAFLVPFKGRLDIRRTAYPGVDIHKTPFESDTYDIVAADQVIEHVLFPQAAILELKRILKPGGIMIITTCAYNPYHGTGPYGDYWRFMPEGLKVLSLPMDGGIRICGGWGTKHVVASRAKLGILSQQEKAEFSKILPDAVSTNDVNDPFVTWIIMQK